MAAMSMRLVVLIIGLLLVVGVVTLAVVLGVRKRQQDDSTDNVNIFVAGSLVAQALLRPPGEGGIFDLNIVRRVKSGDLRKLGNLISTLHGQRIVSASSLFHVDVHGDGGNLREILEGITGVTMHNCYKHVCSISASADTIAAIAASPKVSFIDLVMATSNAGSVVTEGDNATYAQLVRETFGVDGSGLYICVLSDSYDCLGGAQADIDSGDLPSGIFVFKELDCEVYLLKDEGRAMLQIIHDLAPGATLGIRTAITGAADMAAGIEEMVAAGCNILVDDIRYNGVPWFQDGIIAQAADAAVNAGVPFFTSAGNYGRSSWEDVNGFSPGKKLVIDGEELGIKHRFSNPKGGGGTVGSQKVFINNKPGFTVDFHLQWDQPANASESDLDLIILYQGELVQGSFTNNTGGDPREVVIVKMDALEASGDTVELELIITLVSGPPPGMLKILASQVLGVEFELATDSSTCIGHGNAGLVAAVGATSARNVPSYDPDKVARLSPTSSAGGVPIFFDIEGNRLPEPVIRLQPRVTGPDGGLTSFFGLGDEPPFRFFGTSAAAPHVAAIAALMLEYNPNLSPLDLYEILESTALDMDDPATPWFDFGYDTGSGYGLVNASKAMERLIKFGERMTTASPQPQPRSQVSKSSAKSGKGNGKGAKKRRNRRLL